METPIKYILFSVALCNFLWFDLYHIDSLGNELNRSWLASLALTLPILNFSTKRNYYSWFFTIQSYLGLKWTSMLPSVKALYPLLIYEVTLIFIILLCFQRWGQTLTQIAHKLSQLKLVKFFWIFIIYDLIIATPVLQNHNLFHNPIREISLISQSILKDPEKSTPTQVKFHLNKKDENIILLEIPNFTSDFSKIAFINKKELKQAWHIKKQFLLPNEHLDKDTFFIPKQRNVNYTVGDAAFLKDHKNIRYSSISPLDGTYFTATKKIRALYSILKDKSIDAKRLYGNLRRNTPGKAHSLTIQTSSIQLISSFIKKLDQDFPHRTFYIFFLGEHNKSLEINTSKISRITRPFYLITNDDKNNWEENFPLNLKKDTKLNLWSMNLLIKRSHNIFTIQTLFGLFNRHELEISLHGE